MRSLGNGLLRVFVAVVACALSCTAWSEAPKDVGPCTPSFVATAPWLGADAAYSIPLADGRDVWIFGDTLYGDKREVEGSDPRMVHNTIGISTCQGGKWKIDYSIRQGTRGEMQSFFDPPRHDGTWYWALDGFVYRNELWISLLCIRATPKTDAAAIGFETCGTDLAHVTGIDGAPKSWKVEYQPLVPESAHANPSATAVVEGKYAYFVALAEKSRADILTRIPLDGLHESAKNLQYLAADGTWKAGIDGANAKTLIAEGASELSIRYHPELKKWVSIMVSPNMLSDAVLLRTAPSLTGPWSESKTIYHIPELNPSKPGYDKDTFCYAGKEHPEFEHAGDLVFTYACNTNKPKKLETEPNIYFPQAVRIAMP